MKPLSIYLLLLLWFVKDVFCQLYNNIVNLVVCCILSIRWVCECERRKDNLVWNKVTVMHNLTKIYSLIRLTCMGFRKIKIGKSSMLLNSMTFYCYLLFKNQNLLKTCLHFNFNQVLIFNVSNKNIKITHLGKQKKKKWLVDF